MRFAAARLALTLTLGCGAPAAPTPAPDLGADAPASGPVCGLPMPAPVSCGGQADGERCDDNDPCTSGDHCEAGECVSATPGRLCVRCHTDADCCAGIGSINCDYPGSAWAPTGRCLAEGVCTMDSKACRAGESCIPGKGCQ